MKKIISLITVVIILVIAAITNPSKTDYVTYLKDQRIKESNNDFEKVVISKFARGFWIFPPIQRTIFFSQFIQLK